MSLFYIRSHKNNHLYPVDSNIVQSTNNFYKFKNQSNHIINKDKINNNVNKIYNLINNLDKKSNRRYNSINCNKKYILPDLNINIINEGKTIKNENNITYENHKMNAKERANRKIDYSDMIRNQIGDNIRGAKLLKNYLNISLTNPNKDKSNIYKYENPFKYYNKINNNSENNSFSIRRPHSFSRIGKLIISNSNHNYINRPFKVYNHLNFSEKKEKIIKNPTLIKHNYSKLNKLNFKFNIYNQNEESIFMKEEYSNMVRNINGNKLHNQREKKFEHYFNIVYNYPKLKNNNRYNQNIFNIENNVDNTFENDEDYEKKDEKILENITNSEEKFSINENIEENIDIKSEVESNNTNSNEDINESEEIDELLIYENPIEDEIMENLPVTKLNDIEKLSDENRKCPICLEFFDKDDNIIYLPCIHIYHEECIKRWFKCQDFCPICRLKITPENFNEINL